MLRLMRMLMPMLMLVLMLMLIMMLATLWWLLCSVYSVVATLW